MLLVLSLVVVQTLGGKGKDSLLLVACVLLLNLIYLLVMLVRLDTPFSACPRLACLFVGLLPTESVAA